MSAANYTPDEERRYGLPPLPDVPFIGQAACARLNAEYEAQRRGRRVEEPGRDVKAEALK